MSDYDVPFPMALFILVVGCVLTWIVTSGSITEDCKKLGAFREDGKVYECKVKP